MLRYTLGFTALATSALGAITVAYEENKASAGVVDSAAGVAPPHLSDSADGSWKDEMRENRKERRRERNEKKRERKQEKREKQKERKKRRKARRGGGGGIRVPPMNDLPGGYRVANSDPDFKNQHRGEYIEVLSEAVKYDYAEVFWRPMEPIPIEIPTTKMHITGLEFNIVREQPDGTFVDVSGAEAYNHHCVIHFRGTREDGTVPKLKVQPKKMHKAGAEGAGGMHNALYGLEETRDRNGEPIGLETFIGAEARGSFFYTPKGYAMSIDRPADIVIEAMLINIGNNGRCSEESDTCPMPAAALPSHGFNYSPLLECPCTDRIVKEIDQYYLAPGPQCMEPINSLDACVEAARGVGIRRPVHTEEINIAEAAYGCIILQTADGGMVFFNNKEDSTTECARQMDTDYLLTTIDFLDDAEAQITILDGEVMLKMEGPEDKWFAFGFPASELGKMNGALVWIAHADGRVATRRLGDHNPGEDLDGYKTTIVNNTVADGRRTVYLKYDTGLDDFETSKENWENVGVLNQRLASAKDGQKISVIGAVGQGGEFRYHGNTRGGVQAYALPHDVGYCVCKNNDDKPMGTINGVAYNPQCNEQLIREGNPTCNVASYEGGQLCCAGGTILLDKDQSPPEEAKDEVRVKLRVYYEDGEKQEEQPKRTKIIFYAPEGDQAEYDIPVTESGIHVLEKTVEARDWGIKDGHPAELVVLQGHCHTPMCISQELWNADTNELICSTSMNYGTDPNDEVGNEEGYILGSSVCLWGNDEGLKSPPVITADTKLYYKKVANSTYQHYGDMAGWLVQYHDDTL